jgi:monofunctional biosynthetic peptidoglycan transglycosylase
LGGVLPRPRYFEKLPQSVYLSDRAETIMARMNDVALP